MSAAYYCQSRLQESLDEMVLAVDWTLATLAMAPERDGDRARLVDYLSSVLSIASEMGDHRRVAAAAQQYADNLDHPFAGLTIAGQDLTRCVAMARGDGSLEPDGCAELANDYSTAAIDLLTRALQAGEALEVVAGTPGLDDLRGHSDWAKLAVQLRERE